MAVEQSDIGIPGVTGRAQVVKTLVINSTGAPSDPAPGRAAASASEPVTLSNEDKAALDLASGGYTTAAPYVSGTAQAAKRGVLAVVTAAGNATLTFAGIDIVFTFAVGPTVLPLAVTKYTAGTATGAFYNIA